MKKRVIYKAVAIAFIIGGMSFTMNQKALAGSGSLAACLEMVAQCEDHCITNHNGLERTTCIAECNQMFTDCVFR